MPPQSIDSIAIFLVGSSSASVTSPVNNRNDGDINIIIVIINKVTKEGRIGVRNALVFCFASNNNGSCVADARREKLLLSISFA